MIAHSTAQHSTVQRSAARHSAAQRNSCPRNHHRRTVPLRSGSSGAGAGAVGPGSPPPLRLLGCRRCRWGQGVEGGGEVSSAEEQVWASPPHSDYDRVRSHPPVGGARGSGSVSGSAAWRLCPLRRRWSVGASRWPPAVGKSGGEQPGSRTGGAETVVMLAQPVQLMCRQFLAP